MKLKKKNLQIAIDGPVASGKSTGAFLLAQKLGILYVHTGAMYRAVAWLGIKNRIDLQDEEKLIQILGKTKIELKKPSKKHHFCEVFIDGENVTDELFTSKVSWASSAVAVFPKIRKYLVRLQKEMARNRSVVMEGRDITTIVLPKADLKIYMTADLKVRAKRRLKDHLKAGEKTTLSEVIKEVKKRDYNDFHRKASPLKITPDAWVLDTTNLSIKEEIKVILAKLKEKNLIK